MFLIHRAGPWGEGVAQERGAGGAVKGGGCQEWYKFLHIVVKLADIESVCLTWS